MKKLYAWLLLIASSAVLLTGCATLANLQMQKKQLADGSTVYVDINVPPTANWYCKPVGDPQSYNWAEIQEKGQFQLIGPYGLLANNAIAYANEQDLKINYINLQIPQQNTFSTGSGRFTESTVLNPNAQAVVSFYQCEQLNPDHQVGAIKTTDRSFRID